jgi:methionyl-tRNA formyltransferase
MTLRVVFLGNSQSVFSNRHFRALLDTPCELVGVVDAPASKRGSTNPTLEDAPPFPQTARQQGTPVFEPDSPNEAGIVATMRDLSPDLLVAVGYPNILKEDILSAPRIVAANFHASLLPAYRGKHPVFWALRHGERTAGLTVHVMDPGIDTGDILYQVSVRTRKEDTVGALYERIMDRSLKLAGQLVSDAEGERWPRKAQTEVGASYFSSVSEEDFRLDWSMDAETLRRWITITPGKCFTSLAGQPVFVTGAKRVPSHGPASPGELVALGRTRCTIAAGTDAVSIRSARVEGGEERPASLLCRELGLRVGDSLG